MISLVMYAQTCEELADYIRKDANYCAGDCRGLVDAMASEREQRMTPTSMPLPTSIDLTLRFCAAARHDGSERRCRRSRGGETLFRTSRRSIPRDTCPAIWRLRSLAGGVALVVLALDYVYSEWSSIVDAGDHDASTRAVREKLVPEKHTGADHRPTVRRLSSPSSAAIMR